MANAPLTIRNPLEHEFRVTPCNGGGFTVTAYPYRLRGTSDEPTTWAFTNVRDVMAFLQRASDALADTAQPSFDFRTHMAKDPAHGPSS